ncbi:MAG: acyloxyacyl hydrolase [Deltaproteobacteria bacterium]|nr:acyloxyacyl hydrolase [Deltaproteobacteria bacterium]
MAADPPIRYGYFQMLYHTGVFWSRSDYLEEQFKDGYKGIEARIGFQTTGKELWEQYNKYPSYGFGIHYGDLVADPEDTIIGNPFSAFMFYSAPRARFGRFSLNTDLSIGLSYTALIYDPVSNPFNDVIASNFNLYFDFNLNLTCILSDRLDVKAGYGVTHYSNGRIHMPQKGVNNWGWNFGLNYNFVQPGRKSLQDSPEQKPSVRPEYIHTEVPEYIAFKEIQFMYAVGVVDHHPPGDAEGIHYFTSSFTTDYALAFHPRMAVTFGMDMLYDGSLAVAIKGIPSEEVTTFQKMYFGSHLGYHFFINRVTILCNLGTYFLQHSNDRGFWFVRAGGRARLTDHLQAQICIKTKNGVRADWIEWGLAYSLKIR